MKGQAIAGKFGKRLPPGRHILASRVMVCRMTLHPDLVRGDKAAILRMWRDEALVSQAATQARQYGSEASRRSDWRPMRHVSENCIPAPPERSSRNQAANGRPLSMGRVGSRDHSFQDPKYMRTSAIPASLSARNVLEARAPLKQ